MRELGQQAVRGAGTRWTRWTTVGWCLLTMAVAVTQAIAVSPTAAQNTLSPSTVASDTILAWGDNLFGQLGDGTGADSDTPIPVSLPPGTTVTAIAAGDEHSLALTSTGTVLAWGRNRFGQLGDETNTSRSTPVTVSLPPGTTVTAIAAGHTHSLAITSTGSALAWGRNFSGQLGDGTTNDSNKPVAVNLPPGTTVTAIAAGDGHSLAVTSAGTALAWGRNFAGQLGDGTTNDSTTPVTVSVAPGTTVTDIAAGRVHSLAITSAGTALGWGRNGSGQLGDGTTNDSTTPTTVSPPTGTAFTAVAAGEDHSLAVTSAGTALAAGDNLYGQLGDGTNTSSNTFVTVSLPPSTTITAIAVGRFHNLGVTATGAALAWGINIDGQLGDGTTTNRNTPQAVDLPVSTTVAGGFGHSLALAAPPTSTTTLQVTPPSPTADREVTLTAAVTCTSEPPTGTITFRTTTTALATEPLTTGATATHTTTLPAGTHTLTAGYTSTNTCPDSQSIPTSITIHPPADDPGLPITGFNLPTTIGTASLLIVTGAVLIQLAHRRRPTRHPR
ncbi:RCC1 domain-containing protein [Salinispora arenicola]|uniref:RCC1 domain-containing protein n=1 Tax=Salinispora arenicola TaxID=168697 RepID=UPI00207AA98B|nr:RCC1 domain-containing protein [Salinispora arenicola]MCN0180820.1 Ig-like domain repeat protein [Salinispora arenicola]